MKRFFAILVPICLISVWAAPNRSADSKNSLLDEMRYTLNETTIFFSSSLREQTGNSYAWVQPPQKLDELGLKAKRTGAVADLFAFYVEFTDTEIAMHDMAAIAMVKSASDPSKTKMPLGLTSGKLLDKMEQQRKALGVLIQNAIARQTNR